MAINGRVTGKTVGLNKDGIKNVLLLQCELTDPEDIQTVELMNQTGEDNRPPNDSKCVILKIGEAWKIAIATDDKIKSIAQDGEKRVYSTNTIGDTVSTSLHFKNDGTVVLDANTFFINANIELDGDINMTGVITGPSVFNGASGHEHIHPQDSDSGGDSEQDTGVAK